jgi:hypothetical protein
MPDYLSPFFYYFVCVTFFSAHNLLLFWNADLWQCLPAAAYAGGQPAH